MDCTKFETALLDELYGELDDVTRASLRKHQAGCEKCARLAAELTTARDATRLPKVTVPAALEMKILKAAFGDAASDLAKKADAAAFSAVVGPAVTRASSGGTPSAAGNRGAPSEKSAFSRFLAWGGTWAMRPQTAMAALFLFMMGSSVLLLRGKSGPQSEGSMTVTVVGEPAAERANAVASAAPLSNDELANAHGAPRAFGTTAPPAASASPFSQGLSAGGGGAERRRSLDDIAPSKSKAAPYEYPPPSNAGITAGKKGDVDLLAEELGGQGQTVPAPATKAAKSAPVVAAKPVAPVDGCAELARRLSVLQTSQAADSGAIAEATRSLENCRLAEKQQKQAKKAFPAADLK